MQKKKLESDEKQQSEIYNAQKKQKCYSVKGKNSSKYETWLNSVNSESLKNPWNPKKY
jgi:hypothetical protein